MKKKMLLLAACLMLALPACSTQTAQTASAPPEASVGQSSPPESSPEASTPPEAPTPEELLAQQPIDDTHDAFLVDTGGRLGTLLVTAEMGEQDKNTEFGGYHTTLSVWNPQDMDEPIQTMEMQVEGCCFGIHRVEDANFDGYMDFDYTYMMGVQAQLAQLWLWEEEAGRFVEAPEYADISSPQVDGETQTIRGWNRNSAAGDGLTTFYRWEDGKLVCIRRVEADAPWGEAATLLVEDRVDGTLTKVYEREFPWNSNETEVQEAWRQELHKWEDLDYHGE